MPIPFVNTLAIFGAAVLASASGTFTSPNATGSTPSNSRVEIRNSEYNAPQSTSSQTPSKLDDTVKIVDKNRSQGSITAPIWVIEISDMECPYCREWNQNTYPKLYEEFVKTGKVRFAYLNFPLSMHKHARLAAQTAMCASYQGKFWEVKKAIFDSQEKWSSLKDANEYFEELAKKAGADTKDWKSCINSSAINAVIDSDLARVRRAGAKSTPSLVVDDRLVSGNVPMDDLRKMINDAIAKKKK